MRNLILATDSYKQSHFLQYPPEAAHISAYVEARTNPHSNEVLTFGLQAFLLEYLSQPITAVDIEDAAEVCAAHGVPFNRAGWTHILTAHKGFLPLEIRALAEGTISPASVPLVEIVNTDPALPWLSTYIETALLRAIWFPTTVATNGYAVKKTIYAGLVKTSDDPDAQVPFKLHDFGARGVSSSESAGLGGLAHLVNFAGTDTLEAIGFARRFYDAREMPGFSIPAAEHSTMTSWGRARENEAYANMIAAFGGPGKIVAVVSDSYDLDHAVANIWGGTLKSKVLESGGTLVVRPDSGDPVETPLRTLETLWEKFGGATNSKGYRVLVPQVRVIQGDGMTPETIARLVARLIESGFALDNIAFGMGGGLLQKVDRDTLRFAMKANAMKDTSGQWTDVYKKPATDPTKASKAGRQAVVQDDGTLKAIRLDSLGARTDLLRPVWRDGTLLIRDDLATIRARAHDTLKAALAK